MLLEAFLRIARARLMDGAGRRIELQIQTLLMDKLLGMQSGQKGQTPSGTFAAVREFSAIREFFTASTIGTLTDLPFIVLFPGARRLHWRQRGLGVVHRGHPDGAAIVLYAKENDGTDDGDPRRVD